MRSALLGQATAIIVVIIGFFSPYWSWGPLLAMDAYLAFFLWGMRDWHKGYDINAISKGMSDSSRAYLVRYGYYFIWQQTCTGRCTSSGAKQLAGVALSLIHAYQYDWWIVIFGVIHYFLMGAVGNEYDPTAKFMYNPEMQRVHDTVVSHLNELPPIQSTS
jgi:hypothetical protein